MKDTRWQTRAMNREDANSVLDQDNFSEKNLEEMRATDKAESASFDEKSSVDSTAGNARAGASAVKTIANGGSASDVASGLLISSGNPYAIAAGAGLAVLSAGRKRDQKNQELQYKAKLERISRQNSALSNMINVSSSLRNL